MKSLTNRRDRDDEGGGMAGMAWKDDELWEAVSRRDLEGVRKALAKGADANCISPDGWVRDEVSGKGGRSILHHAAYVGDLREPTAPPLSHLPVARESMCTPPDSAALPRAPLSSDPSAGRPRGVCSRVPVPRGAVWCRHAREAPEKLGNVPRQYSLS